MKTLIVFQEVPERTVFIVVDGDHSHLNGVFINNASPDHTNSVKNWMRADQSVLNG
jgi:hypothetical protein